MAVKGKTSYQVYLDANKVETIRRFLDSSRLMPGWSEFVNIFINEFADSIDKAEDDGVIVDLIEQWMIHE